MSIRNKLEEIINNKTKPIGSLGKLEMVALQIGMIQQTTSPSIRAPHIIIFAGDHGIASTGLVNPFPQSVTAQMVLNFLNGGAAINVFCRQNQISLKVVDAGVKYEWNGVTGHPDFIIDKMGEGTRNYLQEEAMSIEQAVSAIEKGRQIVAKLDPDCNCVGFGEMGIGNSSSAALIMSSILEKPVEDCVGRGTGVNDEQLITKIYTLKKVFERHQLDQLDKNPYNLLSKVGGFEIAMMAGAYLQAAKENKIIVVDGFIGTAALLIAQLIDGRVKEFCIFAHTSSERGHEDMLQYLDARPLLNLNLRLGEGTGVALVIPLLRSAISFLNEMASFQSANISKAIQ